VSKPKTEPVPVWRQQVRIPSGAVTLDGELIVPRSAHGVVLFARRNCLRSQARRMRSRSWRLNGSASICRLIVMTEEIQVKEVSKNGRQE
jgi:hypothetical protein